MISIKTSLFAQINAYYPDGRKIKNECKTINELLNLLGEKETTSHSSNDNLVYFKKLTNKPIFVMDLSSSGKNISPEKIKKAISSYKYNDYIYSFSYYYDLREMMKEGSLTKDYLNTVFGKPDEILKNEDQTETLIFRNNNAKIVFENGKAKSVDVVNYNALKRSELAITSFSVTGSDYTMGFNIAFLNLSSKDIKYVFVTVTATNPVDDKEGTKTVKAVGPISSNEAGSYEFEDIFYSRTAKYLSIDKIKVQYMDGSTKNISKSDARNIQVKDWEEEGNRVIY